MVNFKFKLYKKIFNLLQGSGVGRIKLLAKISKNVRTNLKPEYVEICGFRIYLDPTDHFGLSVKPYHIPKIYEKIIKSGDVVVDVGSNIGIHTLYLSKLVGKMGKVYSFEPEPNNFALLKKNVEFNKCNNVIVEQKAISNRTGKIKLSLSDSMAGHRISNSDSQENTIIIDSVSLDDYFKNHDRKIDFIKIDTEGFDGNVIQGMKKIFAKSKNLNMLTEFHSALLKNSDMSPKQFIELIEKNNFTIYDSRDDKFLATNFYELSKKFDDEKYYLTDLFCTHLEKLPKLD
jgi:FkbM family methyltransferase